MSANKILDCLFGFCVGDALGVPVEFVDRKTLKARPVVDMREFGTFNMPAGTWSDDSSLAFCLAESLCKGYNLNDIANNFVKWMFHNHWTPYGHAFDIGAATSEAINNLKEGVSPLDSGGCDENSNGNGSLMRIIPLIFYNKNLTINQRFKTVMEVSAITHGHIRSLISCFIYTEFALQLLAGHEKLEAYKRMQSIVNQFIKDFNYFPEDELELFEPILENNSGIVPIYQYEEVEISSRGYVLDTLEASIWCFLNSNNYSEAVLKAVNLGADTDTTACVTGGLAGLYYGIESIPNDWLKVIAKSKQITELAEKLNNKYSKK